MKKFFALIAVVLIAVPTGIALAIWLKIPSEKDIKGCIVTTMYKVNLCPKNSNYVPLKRISPYLVKAIILTEDSRFWDHQGFDWESIKKNYEENQKVGFYKRGGSTITQQLAKNMFLSAEKSIIRKGLEALITVKIEKVLTKKEIIEKYLNVIEFGKDIYGIKAASLHYFKKSPAELDVVESAFLAMLLPNPKKYAASYYKEELTPFASRRINQIVQNMYQYNRITDTEYNDALLRLERFFRPVEIETAEQSLETGDETLTLEQLEESANSEEEL
jgi:monofunctional biosynthetic peptidoglycan transglycosylase